MSLPRQESLMAKTQTRVYFVHCTFTVEIPYFSLGSFAHPVFDHRLLHRDATLGLCSAVRASYGRP